MIAAPCSVRTVSYPEEGGAAAENPHARLPSATPAAALVGQAAARLHHLARGIAASLVSHQRQYITIKTLEVDALSALPITSERTQAVVVDSAAALEALAAELSPSFRDSVADLRARIKRGCVVCVARRLRRDGRSADVVGYEISERGVFSALGRRMVVADDVIFSHYVEVLPAYRGQRIHRLLFQTRDAYFRQRGGRIVCGVCAPQNHASLQALRRDGALIAGTVRRILLFRAFVLWYTPFERIAHLLR